MRVAAFTMLFLIFALLSVGTPPRMASAASSEEIRKTILTSIERSGKFHGYDLDIDSRGGTIWLRGHVDSVQDRAAIEEIARSTAGVREVHDELNVESSGGESVPELAVQVRRNIAPLSAAGDREILISAVGSTVTLEGTASSAALKQKIGAAAGRTPGAEVVVNNIKVLRPSDVEIAENIRRQITAVPEIQIKNLDISVLDGIATIAGLGKTHRDTDHALALALNVPGVEDVKSKIALENPYRGDTR